MAGNVCPQCGAPIDPSALKCKYCGEKYDIPAADPVPVREMSTYPDEAQQYEPQGMSYGYPQQDQYPAQGYSQPYPEAAPLRAPQPGMPQYPQAHITAISPAWPVKSKTAAGILGIFLGGLGIHKFYLGKIGSGILYLLLCWTGIPAVLGFFEGISYLCSNDEKFQINNHVRII